VVGPAVFALERDFVAAIDLLLVFGGCCAVRGLTHTSNEAGQNRQERSRKPETVGLKELSVVVPHRRALPLTFDVCTNRVIHRMSMGVVVPRPRQLDLLQGTLDLLILKTLSWGPAHGYAIARWIKQVTGKVLTVGEGSLYPSLHRLEERGWITSEWRLSENNRRAKFYTLTAAGRRQFRIETMSWASFVAAVGSVLEATEQPG